MSKAWPSKPLGELLSFLTSGSRGWAAHYRDSGDLFLRIQNVGKNRMMLNDVAFVAPPDTAEARRTLVQPGDVLLSITADLGRTCVVPEGIGRAFINQHLAILRVKNIHPSFLSAYLASPDGQRLVMGRNKQAVKAGLNFDDIRSFAIPLPPLAEQKRIALILDAADALRAKRREAIAKLEALLQSTFLTHFGDPVTNPMGWEMVTVGSEVDFLTSGSRGWAQYYSDVGDVFIRIQNLRGGVLDLSDIAYVNAPDSAEAKRTLVQPGDVLLSITADLGRTAVVPDGIGKAHINQHLAILRFRSMNPTFVSHQIASAGCQTQFVTLNRAAVKAGLNFNDVRSIRLTNPPLPLQQKFAAIVESIERQKTTQRTHLAELDALFAALQHRAFRGEL